jgi:AmmeMemoRadiSam system protein B
MEIRKASFAGSWYPSQASACDREIAQFLSGVTESETARASWIAGIVPHAGGYYSGAVACRVIHTLRSTDPGDSIDLVVIFGMHLHPGSANYMMATGAWETPFGPLPVAEELARALQERFEFQIETPTRFIQDNTIELQLPFVKRLLDPAAVLAIGVPPAERSLDIGRAVVDWARANDRRLKIVGSTDLTHYGPNYEFTPKGTGPGAVSWVRDQNDREVIDAMLAIDPEKVISVGLRHQNACCAGAAATAIAAAKHAGATRSQTIAYATSYDKSPGESFVGYAGVVFG